jgi:ubiquinone/menaquinone biosynthesis C-methylase UbiE
MTKDKTSAQMRSEILSEYYSKVYQEYLFGNGPQAAGISYFERAIEKFWMNKDPNKVLEIGGGNGEHLKYLRYIPREEYISLDIREPHTKVHTQALTEEFLSKLRFIKGDAEALPFRSASFDRVYSTCLLHHVDDVLSVLLEAKRVTVSGGEIAFLIPTDPGVLNQLVKRFISYPKMRKLSKIKPELFYAIDHKNHVGSILQIISFVFEKDDLTFHFRPFGIKSWNLNLIVVAKIIKA